MTVHLRKPEAERFRDDIDTFAQGVQRHEREVAKLLAPAEALEQDPAVLRRALAELRSCHEELLVAEEELRAQLDALVDAGVRVEAERARFAEVFEHGPDALLVTDASGLVREANAVAVALFNVPLRYLRGKPIVGLVEEESGSSVHARTEALRTGTERTMTLRCAVRQRGGEMVTCEARILLAADERFLWSIRRDEAPDARGNADLARALRDKTELLERERRLREEHERTGKAKDRFIGVLSHDLRSPLNAILGWTQLLMREALDGQGRMRALATIERNAHAQAALLDELLDLSRIAMEQFHLELAPVDLGELTASVVEASRSAADRADVALSLVVPDEPMTVLGDRVRLEQVVGNLIGNALTFTPPGGTIGVSLARREGTVDVKVRDDGRGIPATVLPRIFDLYQSRDSVTSRHGLGLGLYVVRRLVEAQLGTARAESDGPGKGATFVVSLPIRSELVPEAEAPISGTQRITPTALGGLRVLVVDDDEDARELSTTILRRANADVQSAASAPAALELLRHGTFDAVISDLAMPGRDGYSFVKALRQVDRNLAGVALTGYASTADVERSLAAGFDAHVCKPCEAAVLVDAVQRAVYRRRS